jgi:hypothetical protein
MCFNVLRVHVLGCSYPLGLVGGTSIMSRETSLSTCPISPSQAVSYSICPFPRLFFPWHSRSSSPKNFSQPPHSHTSPCFPLRITIHRGRERIQQVGLGRNSCSSPQSSPLLARLTSDFAHSSACHRLASTLAYPPAHPAVPL